MNTTYPALYAYINDVLHKTQNIIFKRRGYSYLYPAKDGIDVSVKFGAASYKSYYHLDSKDKDNDIDNLLTKTIRNRIIAKYLQDMEYSFRDCVDENHDNLIYNDQLNYTIENRLALFDAVWDQNKENICDAYDDCIEVIVSEEITMRECSDFCDYRKVDMSARVRDFVGSDNRASNFGGF